MKVLHQVNIIFGYLRRHKLGQKLKLIFQFINFLHTLLEIFHLSPNLITFLLKAIKSATNHLYLISELPILDHRLLKLLSELNELVRVGHCLETLIVFIALLVLSLHVQDGLL
jgi:hypothetical protein